MQRKLRIFGKKSLRFTIIQEKSIYLKKTMSEIVQSFGLEKTKEVFATVAAIKKHDGRIYGKNREYMNSIPVDSENVEWRSGNPVVYAGLDDIHTTHIDQLITELRKLDN